MRTPHHSLAVIAAAGAAALGGCGSSGPHTTSTPGVPHFAADAYRYAACMRNHGVTNFPDPKVSSHNGEVSVMMAVGPVDFNSPQAKSAQHTCQHLMPAPNSALPARDQARRTQAFVAFARCMRAHGVTRFPDPTSSGQLTLSMLSSAGVDLHAPQTLTDGLVCAPLTHGIITRADVQQAVNGNH